VQIANRIEAGTLLMNVAKLLARYRVDDPKHFRLESIDCADTGGLDIDKDDAEDLLKKDVKRLTDLQERLYADNRWALLMVLQGLDTSGKDGAIEHVMSGVNPQGCQVHSFKAPSTEELAHDFLWRAVKHLPRRGYIGIFNRSYYEEVAVVRVHPELLERQNLPASVTGEDIWKKRFKDIRAFERHLVRSGTAVLKIFLHVSKEEQRQRLLARLEEPGKRWKFSLGDIAERKLWDDYTAVYEEAICATSRAKAPWYVVPADHKWFARLVIAAAVVDTLEKLDPQFPQIKGEALKDLEEARKTLIAEKGRGH
jgi:PPK2 family polyphosphate:nucleotide phosphotransferase